MSEIYGMNSTTYRMLGAEDQASVRAAHQQTSAAEKPAAPAASEAPPAAPAQAPAVPPSVSQAKTPQQAVSAIHAMPPPKSDDLRGLSSVIVAAVFEPRAEQFNESRSAAAEEALTRLAPQRSDYSALNDATADAEYALAMGDFNSDPYVQELNRIVEEAAANPTEVPEYLTRTESSGVAAQLSPQAMRDALAVVGVDIPVNPTPEQMQDGYAILATMPDDVLGWAINPGSQVTFDTPVAGAATIGLPLRASADIRVIGQVELSDVRTGANFEQTQQFEMSVQTQTSVNVAFGKTALNRMYGWAERLGALPDSAIQRVNDSPILRNVLKGLPIPVSARYEQYTGERITYRATVTPEQGAQIAAGDLSATPNPLDPMNMPIGSSTMFIGQSLEGTHFEANYKLFRVGGDHTELSGQGFGVTRVDENIVEVYSGPVDTVENASFVGLGLRSLASAGMTVGHTHETQTMQVARIDLRTVEGQAAYQTFMSSGKVPDWTPPGVPQAGKTIVSSSEYVRQVGVQLGPLTWQNQLAGNDGTLTWTEWQDGSVDVHNTYSSDSYYDDARRTADISGVAGADGQLDAGSTTYRLILSDYHDGLSSELKSAFDPAQGFTALEGEQNVQMTFTAEELMDLQAQAEAYMQSEYPHRVEEIEQGAWNLNALEKLSVATTPDEVFRVLYEADTSVASTLMGLARGSGEAVPGAIAVIAAGG